MNRYDLDGRSLLVTGGAGGIGRAIASAALASGARVSLWDHAASALEDAAKGLAGADRVTLRHVDVTDQALIHFEDASPLDVTTAAAASGGLKSMFQTAGIGLKATLNCGWALRSTSGLAWVGSVIW